MNRVKFKKLNIRSLPGLPRGIAKYQDLDSDIVLIIGHNASGKSSTIRAIKEILWEHDNNNYDVSAVFYVDGDKWDVEFNHGKLVIYKNGQKTEEELPKYQYHDRYILRIGDLLTSTEDKLAEKIQEEIFGGLRPDEIIKSESYSDKNYSPGKQEYKQLDKARKAVKDKKREQEKLLQDQDSLETLEHRVNKLKNDIGIKELIEKATSIQILSKQLTEKKNELDAYPSIMENLRNFSLENLERWKKEREEERKRVENSKNTIKQVETEIEALKIRDQDLKNTDLRELEELKDAIRVLNQDTNRYKEEKEAALIELKQLSAQLGYREGDKLEDWEVYETLQNIELEDIDNLDRIVDEYHNKLVPYRELLARIDILEAGINEIDAEETLDGNFKAGITSLSYWLKEYRSRKAIVFGTFVVYVIILLGIIAGCLIYFEKDLQALLPIVIVYSFIFYLIVNRINAGGKIRKQDYQDAGFENLPEWDVEMVTARIDELIERAETSWRLQSSEEELERLKSEFDKKQSEIQSLYNQILGHKAIIAEALHLSEDELTINAVKRYADKISQWQDAHTRYIKSLNNKKGKRIELSDKISRFNDILADTNYESAETVESVGAVYSDVKDEINNSRNLNRDLQSARETLGNAQKQYGILEENIQGEFKKVEKTEKDETEIKTRLEELNTYESLKRELSNLQANIDREKEEYEKRKKELHEETDYLDQSIEQLRIDIKSYEGIQDEMEKIQRQIGSINGKIERARESNDMESAILEKEKARGELRALFEENLSKKIGKIILDKLRSQEREENQPQVLQRANKLLKNITIGKYGVTTDSEADKLKFMGLDLQMDRKIPLSELSSGTRIQLLLALRIASIEQQEKNNRNWRMPLLVDEILANSDDVRSVEAIKALIEVSKNDRQVFYFTAQNDEIVKWNTYLEKESTVTSIVYELTGAGNKEKIKLNRATDIPKGIIIDIEVPKPVNSVDKYAYKQVLEENGILVPEYNLLTDIPTEMHLWYLVDDMKILYRLLKRNLITWGQLKAFSDTDRYKNVIEEHRIADKAELLKRYQVLFKIGRPKPVNRKILLDNGVTDTKIDAVMELLESDKVNYDTQKLMEWIDSLEGIGRGRKENLKESLIENGYLPTEEPIDEEEMKRKLLHILSGMSLSEKEAQEFLEQF